jgi:hypothetical protein
MITSCGNIPVRILFPVMDIHCTHYRDIAG